MEIWQFLIILIIICIIVYFPKLRKFQRYLTLDISSPQKIDPEEQEKALFRKYATKKEYLMTETEKKFFDKLKKILSETEYMIFSNVRLADIVNIRSGTNEEYGERNGIFNKVKSKHIDFVITDARGKILKCIELDDKSHNLKKSEKPDNTKNIVLEITNTPFIRFKVWEEPNFEILFVS